MMAHFANSQEHLLTELERIDLLVRGHVARVRALQTEDEQFRGLYISEQEVDALLDKPIGTPQWVRTDSGRAAQSEASLADLARHIRERKQESEQRGITLRLERLRERFGLSRFDLDALLIGLAAELDLRYERLYAYLQDDVTKKKPSVELVLNLLAPSMEGKLAAMSRLSPGASLLRYQLLELLEDPSQPRPPLIGKYLRVDDRIARFLFGSDEPDERVWPFVESIEPRLGLDELAVTEEVRRGLRGLASETSDAARTVVHLQGPFGVGKQAVAAALCHENGMRLLVVDLGRLVGATEVPFAKALALVEREAGLQGAVPYWKGFDALSAEQFRGSLSVFRHRLEEGPGLSILGSEVSWDQGAGLRAVSYFSVPLPRPTGAQRAAFWRDALDDSSLEAALADITALAAKFRFTRGQIEDAVATAKNLARWRDPGSPCISLQDLYEASRSQSSQNLATLARKITPAFQWGDIVLPADRVAQLREICNHVKYRDRVYAEWGFERKLSLGKGLTVLFAGPSGTGKTMAAEILARELGLDLYKIDLSSVISKYIGETEKNLARIFDEAETSNAILFFDEADALFGKRSEVRDSHDRYANIEVGYLLQRMEEYQGVAILATNFRKNMDEAFVRRLQFTVEFPFPTQDDRHRIWTGIWPDETPRDAQMDLEFLARRFEITGGNIRNIALASAFLAADDGSTVRMEHVIVATQREYAKMGKLMAEGEFKVVGAPG
jgi:AAA+ superfamily predicted ATPase